MQKDTADLTVFIALLGSERIKAAHKKCPVGIIPTKKISDFSF